EEVLNATRAVHVARGLAVPACEQAPPRASIPPRPPQSFRTEGPSHPSWHREKELLGHEEMKWTVVYTEVTDQALSVAVLRLAWPPAGRRDPMNGYPALCPGVLYVPTLR